MVTKFCRKGLAMYEKVIMCVARSSDVLRCGYRQRTPTTMPDTFQLLGRARCWCGW